MGESIPPVKYGIGDVQGGGDDEGTDSPMAAARRIENSQSQLGAFINVCNEETIASEVMPFKPESSTLAGWSIAVKDNIDVGGMPTTAGTLIWRSHVADRDAEAVRAVRNAGAFIVGKTNMDELGWGGLTDNPHYGRTNNPWDLSTFVGGSSGGSAAAVASRVCRAALGTDTGGSVRLPASFTGIVGYRPSWGGVSAEGVRALAPSMDVVGALATSVQDVDLIRDAIRRRPLTSKGVLSPNKERANEREYVIGFDPSFLDFATNDVARVTEQAITSAANAGCIVQEVRVKEFSTYLEPWMILHMAEPAELYSAMLQESPHLLSADVKGRLRAGQAFTSGDLRRAMLYRSWFSARFFELLGEVDALLTPTVPFGAVPHGTRHIQIGQEEHDIFALLPRFTGLASISGAPAISLPAGLSTVGLPIGIQLIGKLNRDQRLLDVAHRIEGILGWSIQPRIVFGDRRSWNDR